MESAIVSVRQVPDYDPARIRAAIDAHFEALHLENDLFPGCKVLVKPNLLTNRKPEEAVTTHPAVISAIVDWLREHGVEHIVVADSSGGPFTESRMKPIYAASGLENAVGDLLNRSYQWGSRHREENVIRKNFNLIQPVLDADLIINAAKIKTHQMTTLSAGIKNLFGCIPGLQKPEMHYIYPKLEDFSGMLVDLAQTVAPVVTVLDGVLAMEGDGPSGGTVRQLGCTFAARNLFAQDYLLCSVLGMNPNNIAMVRIARERGLFVPSEIQRVGDELPVVEPFKLPKSTASIDFVSRFPSFLQAPLRTAAKKIFRPTPRLNVSQCIGCGRCAESCPAHTIQIVDKKAKFDLSKCISCFCCQEMCPAKAIRVRHII